MFFCHLDLSFLEANDLAHVDLHFESLSFLSKESCSKDDFCSLCSFYLSIGDISWAL